MAPWSISIVLIILAAVHIGEETLAGFTRFLNTKWFDGSETCPVSPLKSVLVDKIVLFLIIAGLAISGARFSGIWILVAVGIIAADLIQHAIFSLVTRGYTPGVATSVLYLIFVIYFFAEPQLRGLVTGLWAWVALVVGAGFIVVNYMFARNKVRRGDCLPATG